MSQELPMSGTENSPLGTASASEANQIRDAIAEAIAEHRVILFMKGTPEAPACGFSARTVGALQALDTPFAAVDVLPDPRIRQELSALSDWPTIPQLFIDGALVGGCAPGSRAAGRARPGRAGGGHRRRDRLRRPRPARALGGCRRAGRRRDGGGGGAGPGGPPLAEDLVLPGHAGVPAPRRADRQGA